LAAFTSALIGNYLSIGLGKFVQKTPHNLIVHYGLGQLITITLLLSLLIELEHCWTIQSIGFGVE
jgi:integral membrane sensor domain MASE1